MNNTDEETPVSICLSEDEHKKIRKDVFWGILLNQVLFFCITLVLLLVTGIIGGCGKKGQTTSGGRGEKIKVKEPGITNKDLEKQLNRFMEWLEYSWERLRLEEELRKVREQKAEEEVLKILSGRNKSSQKD